MQATLLESIFILLLIVANGWFAMSEIAMVSARRYRLEHRAAAGDAGARAALDLLATPSRFLSAIQLGITLVGVMAGAVGGATLAVRLADALGALPPLAPYADAIGVAVVVVAITYASLVLGELVPKRLALSRPERIAALAAPWMQRLARLARPAVAILSASTEAAARLLRIRAPAPPTVTEEEIRRLIERAAVSGAVQPVEREIVERVFRLGDRSVSTVMTPHPDMVWLDLENPEDDQVRRLVTSGHSRFPVVRGGRDNVVGMLHTQDLLAQHLAGRPLDVETALRPALFLPETMPALGVLEQFREARSNAALVLDEYGSLQGIVTAADVLEGIVGELPERRTRDEPEVFQRQDGSWLFDGAVPIDELKLRCEVATLPGEEERRYETVGGFVMAYLGRVPDTGDAFEWAGYRFEVMDMDQRRVDKVLVTPQPNA